MKVRSLILGLCIAVLVIFIVQNLGITRISFLVWELSLPRAILFFLIFILGFLTGLASRRIFR